MSDNTQLVKLLKKCQQILWNQALFENGNYYELVQEIELELSKVKK